jgi:hypothetical protein
MKNDEPVGSENQAVEKNSLLEEIIEVYSKVVDGQYEGVSY